MNTPVEDINLNKNSIGFSNAMRYRFTLSFMVKLSGGYDVRIPSEIDLNTQTIKKIEGIPYTDGHSVAIEYHNGEVLFAAYSVDASGVFAYNPTTEKVRQALSTSGNIAYMHFFN